MPAGSEICHESSKNIILKLSSSVDDGDIIAGFQECIICFICTFYSILTKNIQLLKILITTLENLSMTGIFRGICLPKCVMWHMHTYDAIFWTSADNEGLESFGPSSVGFTLHFAY